MFQSCADPLQPGSDARAMTGCVYTEKVEISKSSHALELAETNPDDTLAIKTRRQTSSTAFGNSLWACDSPHTADRMSFSRPAKTNAPEERHKVTHWVPSDTIVSRLEKVPSTFWMERRNSPEVFNDSVF